MTLVKNYLSTIREWIGSKFSWLPRFRFYRAKPGRFSEDACWVVEYNEYRYLADSLWSVLFVVYREWQSEYNLAE